MAKNLIVILGATASGKTRMAARLAYDLSGEIISADSRQVYRNMNIGTGKDLEEFTIHDRQIPYYLIDVAEPEEEFNLFEFQRQFYEIFSNIRSRNVLPVLVGGTGLYLESVLCAYDLPEAPVNREKRKDLDRKTIDELQDMLCTLKPRMHNKTDLDDKERLIRAIEIEWARMIEKKNEKKRPVMDAVVFGIRWEREELRKRITKRLEDRVANGMIQEVADLHSSGLRWDRLDSFGLEYRFISMYLQNKMSFDDMKRRLNTAIHQFAKRQETWFRRMEKKGVVIHWIEKDNYPLLKASVIKHLK